MPNKWEDNKDIQILQEYLRIPSVHSDNERINYEPCVEFLERQAKSLDLTFNVYRLFDVKAPIVVISWFGENPALPSIMLNSHMDVVPAYADQWSHPPFAANIDEEGRIYARGTQDTKAIGMQYLAAIRELKNSGQTFKRTIHVTFVPDEEIGGTFGMKQFVHHDVFKSLNIGFALDEAYMSPNDTYRIYYGERSNWKIVFKCSGHTGHGSVNFKNTAGEKLAFIMQKMYEFRKTQVEKMENDPTLEEGDITSVNLTMVNGGVLRNVIPSMFTAMFDVRLVPDFDLKAFEKQLNDWCVEAGGGIEIEFLEKDDNGPNTVTHLNSDNKYWMAIQSALTMDLNAKYKTLIMPGNTDMWFVRMIGVPAIGLSPFLNTPDRAHENDEFITVDEYFRGIEVYKKILLRLANVL